MGTLGYAMQHQGDLMGGAPQLVTSGLLALASGGLNAVYNVLTASGETVAQMHPEARDAVINAVMKAANYSPSGVTGSGGTGPMDPSEALSVLGFIPRPLPPLHHWPYSVTFDMHWPMHPWFSHDPPYLANMTGAEDVPTYVPDDTWKSPFILPGYEADIALTDFKWPLGPSMRPYAGSMNVDTLTSPQIRYIPPKISQAWKVYNFYRMVRFMIDIEITQSIPCRSDVYCALFVPRDLKLWDTTDVTGAAVQGTDVHTMPPCARTLTSLTTDQAVGVLEGQQFTATVGIEGQRARLAAMRHSSYCMGIVKFPAFTGTSASYGSAYTDATGVQFAGNSNPAQFRPVTRRLGFNELVTNLMATKGIVDEFATIISPNYNREDFIGTLSYRPVDTDSSDETPFRYGLGNTSFGTKQITSGTNAMAGCRLIWFAAGPSFIEGTDIVGHDQVGQTEFEQIAQQDLGNTTQTLTQFNEIYTGLYAGSFRCKSSIGAQFNFFDLKPGELEAQMGIGTTDQS